MEPRSDAVVALGVSCFSSRRRHGSTPAGVLPSHPHPRAGARPVVRHRGRRACILSAAWHSCLQHDALRLHRGAHPNYLISGGRGDKSHTLRKANSEGALHFNNSAWPRRCRGGVFLSKMPLKRSSVDGLANFDSLELKFGALAGVHRAGVPHQRGDTLEGVRPHRVRRVRVVLGRRVDRRAGVRHHIRDAGEGVDRLRVGRSLLRSICPWSTAGDHHAREGVLRAQFASSSYSSRWGWRSTRTSCHSSSGLGTGSRTAP